MAYTHTLHILVLLAYKVIDERPLSMSCIKMFVCILIMYASAGAAWLQSQ